MIWVEQGGDRRRLERLAHLVGATSDAVQEALEVGDGPTCAVVGTNGWYMMPRVAAAIAPHRSFQPRVRNRICTVALIVCSAGMTGVAALLESYAAAR